MTAVRNGVLCLLVLGFVLPAACTTDDRVRDVTNAVAAYVPVSPDRSVLSSVHDDLSKALEDEESEPAGFIRGLRSTSAHKAADGVWAMAVIFQADVTVEQRQVFAGRANDLGLSVMWLGPDDEWPYCTTRPRCFTIREDGDYP